MAQPAAALTGVLDNETTANRRMWAAFRLGEYRQATAVPTLIQALNDESQGVRGRAAAALIRVGDPALPLLRVQLQQAVAGVQNYVAAILGYAGNREDIEILRRFVLTQGPGELASVALRSVELINSFMQPDDGFIDYAQSGML